MKKPFGLALAMALAATATPAAAQQQQQAKPAEVVIKLNKAEQQAIAPLQKAVVAKDWAAAAAALPAAQAAAASPGARYMVGRYALEMGLGTNDERAQAAALDTMIASGHLTAPADLLPLYRNAAAFAIKAGDKAKEQAMLARIVELSPQDGQARVNLAIAKSKAGDKKGAIELFQSAIDAQTAAGGKADERWYKFALQMALDEKLGPQSLKLSRDLLQAYPTDQNRRIALQVNSQFVAGGDASAQLDALQAVLAADSAPDAWRTAIATYARSAAGADTQARIDTLRLMRATKTLKGENDWLFLASELNRTGLPGEAKAVLQEGAALREVSTSNADYAALLRSANERIGEDRAGLAGLEGRANSSATGTAALKLADAYMGYGEHAKAASLYRTAIQKGSIDADVARLRLGVALALAGQRAEAETALKAVGGSRSELAALWLLWLANNRG